MREPGETVSESIVAAPRRAAKLFIFVTIVLDMCAELVRAGYGILEDLPVVNSQILYLKSGEIYWFGPHEVVRLQ